MRAVSSVKRKIRFVGAGENMQKIVEVEIKFWDKPGPLKLAGRHVGLFPNEVKVGVGEDSVGAILARAVARRSNSK